MSQPLILIANPGSASRKYALFEGGQERGRLHFEWVNNAIYYTLSAKDKSLLHEAVSISSLEDATMIVPTLLGDHDLLHDGETIDFLGLRIVAPGSYFLQDHKVTEEFTSHLHKAKEHAPLHIEASLQELLSLQKHFSDIPIYGISDSAFHITKPSYAWNYGISLELADRLEIKRFGYHGLSVASTLVQLPRMHKVIVCHLGSGASITAVENSKSKDTTMGYSPLEGLIMSTRSGSIDISAASRLKAELNLDDKAFEAYLNSESGLRGLGGSSDIRQLLEEEETDPRARLALETYVYAIQKSIGQMAAALNGCDALVFTGTVGQRSAPIRERITVALGYLGFHLDSPSNSTPTDLLNVSSIHNFEKSKPIYVVPAREEKEMADRILKLLAA